MSAGRMRQIAGFRLASARAMRSLVDEQPKVLAAIDSAARGEIGQIAAEELLGAHLAAREACIAAMREHDAEWRELAGGARAVHSFLVGLDLPRGSAYVRRDLQFQILQLRLGLRVLELGARHVGLRGALPEEIRDGDADGGASWSDREGKRADGGECHGKRGDRSGGREQPD
mgnify:CR=1 FL=1